ncbi:unnamed protein product [Closterium sp. NIES-53]
MFGIRNGRGDVPSSPAPAEGRAPVGTAEPAPAAAEAEAAANLAGAGAGAEAAAAAAAAAATDQAPYRYDIVGFNADAPVDARGLDEAARYIAGILEEERRANPGVTYIVGGISQGGSLSLYLMCRKALGSFADGSDASSLSFIASIGLSTWLPNCSLIPGPGGADAAVAERAARHPLFMTHGEGTVWAGRGKGGH